MTKRLFCLTLLLTVGILSYNFAQDNTKVGLPEGAIARLGKGGINLMRFSPDGTRLVVGTDVGCGYTMYPMEKRRHCSRDIHRTSQRTRFLKRWENARKRRVREPCNTTLGFRNCQQTLNP